MKKINAFILAAGKGTRLNNGKPSDIPKVLYKIGNRPMISYSLDLLKKVGIKNPIVIVGYKAALVKRTLGHKGIIYVLQRKQLGTGHAILCAKDYLKECQNALIMGGDDSAFYKPSTIKKLIHTHQNSKATITLLTIQINDPYGLGRIVRDQKGKIIAIVEEKEATIEQKKIKEINAGCYCINSAWLLKNLSRLKLHPQTKEYYLTDLVKIAIEEGEKVTSVKVTNPFEWRGINTPEELKKANQLIYKLKR